MQSRCLFTVLKVYTPLCQLPILLLEEGDVGDTLIQK